MERHAGAGFPAEEVAHSYDVRVPEERADEVTRAEADGNLLMHVTAAKLKLQGGSPVALNLAIDSVRKGGTVSVVGAYGPIQSAVKFGEAEIITHRIPLEHIAEGYHIFSAKLDNCLKPVIVPDAA